MGLITKSLQLPKSNVSMLPIIDLHATDSLLIVCRKTVKKVECRERQVTSNEQIYMKACEIVSSMKMKVYFAFDDSIN